MISVPSANFRRMVWKEKTHGASAFGEDFMERVGFGGALKEWVGFGSKEVKLLKLYPEKTGGIESLASRIKFLLKNCHVLEVS